MMTGKQTGGPVVHIPTGRRDGKVSSASNVRPNIVDTSFTMTEMIKLFSSKGLSLEDLVTLSGRYILNSKLESNIWGLLLHAVYIITYSFIFCNNAYATSHF